MKYFLGLLILFVPVSLYAITYDDATHVQPPQAIAHDIIKVQASKVSRYCDFDAQIVRLPHQVSSHHVYYECTYIGEKRKVLR